MNVPAQRYRQPMAYPMPAAQANLGDLVAERADQPQTTVALHSLGEGAKDDLALCSGCRPGPIRAKSHLKETL